MNSRGSGLILGKFLPPHLGHVYLVDFARHYCSELTLVLGSLAREPIPGAVREAWLRELFPDVRVVHLTDENPQYPAEHADFWSIWQRSLRQFVPHGVDFVFASEPYGAPLAKRLGARYVPVDHARELVPVAASMIRAEPLRHWRYLPAPVRPWYVRRVCIVGPESSGKTTLARNLASHFDSCYVHEYARGMIESQGNRFDHADYDRIVRGQLAAEWALARQANRLLFCDTDPLTTMLWADYLHCGCTQEIRQIARTHTYDHYLLLAPDIPWVDDHQRFQPDQTDREGFFDRLKQALEASERSYTVIRGSGVLRVERAIASVEGRFGNWGRGEG